MSSKNNILMDISLDGSKTTSMHLLHTCRIVRDTPLGLEDEFVSSLASSCSMDSTNNDRELLIQSL